MQLPRRITLPTIFINDRYLKNMSYILDEPSSTDFGEEIWRRSVHY
jgi:hypothetical protein